MATAQLDHIVLLLPHNDVLNPPKWITDHFKIAPGGRHGDGKTENKLIVFKDGSYIELIAFVDDDPKHKEGHWWGNKGYGIIDYALTLKEGPDAFERLQEKINGLPIPSNWKPQPLKGGSRLKPDGEKIEWRVAFPQAAARGKAPFWCFDVTSREKRVPKDAELVNHPSGVKGVASLSIFADQASLKSIQQLLDVVISQPADQKVDDLTWDLATPQKISSFVPCQLSASEANESQLDALKNGRTLVARLSLFADGEAPVRRNLTEKVEGDEVSLGFVTA